MDFLFQGLRLIVNPFFNIVTIFLNCFIHRDKSVILFGGRFGKRFAGNSRFLFQYCHKERKKLGFSHVVWVTRSKSIYDEMSAMGYECYMMYSLQSLFYHLKAMKHVIDGSYIFRKYSDEVRKADILTVFSYGAECYFLTHAAKSIKIFEKQGNEVPFFWDLYYKITSSSFIRGFIWNPGGWGNLIYLSNHELEMESPYNVRIAGLPELCKCIAYTPSEEIVLKKIPKGRRLLLYAPTVHMKEAKQYKSPLNDKDFCAYLLDNNYYWIEKLHPAASDDMKANNYDPRYALLLDTEFDLNILVYKMDLVITDYSTIYQKAVWYNIPYAFYASDFEYFVYHDLGLDKWFIEFASAEFCYNTKMLERDIEKKLHPDWIDSQKGKYEKIRNELFNVERTSYEKICEALFS